MRAPEKRGAGARQAKLFRNGRSQAVRLPKEFRFEGSAVRIRRAGRAVILEPLGEGAWPAGFWENMPRLDKDWRRPPDPVPPPIDAESA